MSLSNYATKLQSICMHYIADASKSFAFTEKNDVKCLKRIMDFQYNLLISNNTRSRKAVRKLTAKPRACRAQRTTRKNSLP